ncbi:MAG TPA: aminotransferase class III-fold pyridoxal phosphate-dependent enzyme, partial [Stellaceae bacterium]|nr:aminotransferase class III-fold pyridoxal phosphate-dependent enzyme [Stellaceae bacterium]
MLRANSIAGRDIAFNLHPYTNLKKFESEGPLVMARGKGIRVWDEAGREYIEGLAGLWCTALGFGEERLVEAAARQMRELSFYHLFNGKTHAPAALLAERLVALAPAPTSSPRMSKVFFGNSGSEANDTAMKLVWYYNNARGLHAKKK